MARRNAKHADEETKPGRPPGATNKEYAVVEEIPAVCVRCQSPHRTIVKGSKTIERELAGQLRSGLRYRAIRWTRMVCECGQRMIVKTYFPAELPAGIEN